MSELWTAPSGVGVTADLIGYAVHATDGGVGKVARATAGTINDNIVVDTDRWLFGKQVLLPVGMIGRVDHQQRTVHLSLTRQRIKDGPEYDPDRHDRDDGDFWSPYDGYYGQPWEESDPPLMG